MLLFSRKYYSKYIILKNFIAKAAKSQETKNFTLIIIVIAGINFVFVSQRVSLRDQCNLLRPLQNGTFCPISAEASLKCLSQPQISARSEALALSSKYLIYSCGCPPEADRLPPLKVRDLRLELEQVSADSENYHFSKVSN